MKRIHIDFANIKKSQIVGLVLISILYAVLSTVADGFRDGGDFQSILEHYGSVDAMLIFMCLTMLFVFALGLILFSIWSYG